MAHDTVSVFTRTLSILLCGAALASVAGCSGESGKVSVKAPGVSVERDGDHISVRAPVGVSVDVNGHEVAVNAPLVKVRSGDAGVKVRAPFVRVDGDEKGVSVDAPLVKVRTGNAP